MVLRRTYELKGTVQGVGFRPAVWRLAQSLAIGGSVQNRSGSVRLIVEGSDDLLRQFILQLPRALPAQAQVATIMLLEESEVARPEPFEILPSVSEEDYSLSFPPDLATCKECLDEIFDLRDRRYGYPFTTCTVCGPRYTVINGMPYDRERTTLAAFPLCEACQLEYEDPSGRRFHAESIACPNCGPRLWLADPGGSRLPIEPLAAARMLLAKGNVVAVRGIGGYLLACDARNPEAVKRIRERKDRPHKPLAVMARCPEVLRKYCHISEQAERLLYGQEAPIVILDVREEAHEHLPLSELSPDTDTLGVMLPYSPLHYLLFHPRTGDEVPPFDLLEAGHGFRRLQIADVRRENDAVFEAERQGVLHLRTEAKRNGAHFLGGRYCSGSESSRPAPDLWRAVRNRRQ